MKKTILTLALALISAISFANINANVEEPQPISTYELDAKETLNSFCKAVMKGNINVVKQLIDLGEDVNQKSLGKTPAMYAARYNKAEVLSLLIAHGADLRITSDSEKYTAKKFAELSNAKEVLAVIQATEQKK
ncbi:ankyrin repeat domain-containing protein [Mesonia aquimarina]|uniref:ankyrin repeat domain-containing protein n=1 Tax=Mesonia aquimarina TaxID=1504967 RepID=UPI000EF5BF25|nr:ankyrin repeat domain-containing protein [Mesonia aquimarina]